MPNARPVLARALALATLCLTLAPDALRAAEGMWLPEQLPALSDTLQQAGLRLQPHELADLENGPLAAIVSLGGCSAAFVSAEGLIVTNHHCVESALSYNSTPQDNLLEAGFLATRRSDERWAGPGSRVFVTTRMADVTDAMHGARDAAASDPDRFFAVDRAEKTLVAGCEASGPYRCRVASFDGGLTYRLIQQIELEDVRLVYAPAGAIGFYGGDEDNWRWPRHTGDYAFLRAYTRSDGTPAPHHVDNVPYRPRRHLHIAQRGVEADAFVMVAGYPGTTNRHRRAVEVTHAYEVTYPWQIETLAGLLQLLDERMGEDEGAHVRLHTLRFGLANVHKNNQGMLDGFRRTGVVQARQARDHDLRRHLEAAGDTTTLRLLDELDDTLTRAQRDQRREVLLGWMRWTVRLVGAAHTAWRLAREREKTDDLARDAGFQERDWPRIAERFARLDRIVDPIAETRLLAFWLRQADALPEGERIDAVDHFLGAHRGDRDPYLSLASALLDGSSWLDGASRERWLQATTSDWTTTDDPLARFVAALGPLHDQLVERARVTSGALVRLRPAFHAALHDVATTPLYPDANGTLRITFGHIRGYAGPDGIVYLPFTSLRGLQEKERGEAPFQTPPAVHAAIIAGAWGPWGAAFLRSVPVNFLSTLDTTGGNSGSATLDADGRLVGLLFDGNYEAMASDWLFDSEATRSIHVDIRYTLWLMDRVHGAHGLMRELGVEPAFAPR